MRLLIVGSLDGQIGAASQIAISRGAKVIQADDIDGGLRALRSGQGADLVMVDVRQDVASLIHGLKSERINVPVVACGIGNDTPAAVSAIKAGAREFVPLPPSVELIAAVLAAVAEESHAIIFKDPRMAEVLKLAEQVAPSDASILIVGASGTGKELLARHVHAKSRRAKGRFVAVNCAAIPENLLESELFGHERGAFTGAVARRIGKFEEANEGTLLLDEISEMAPSLQAKLLRAVQEREIDRVGGTRPVKVDVRILATSNRNLEQEIAKGNFREDLYYRLNVITLDIPPLRDRRQDIPVLTAHFIDKYAEANGIDPVPLSEEASRMLMDYAWPGNVRELENTLHRAVLLASGGEIGLEAILLTGASLSTGDSRVGAARAAGQATLGGEAGASGLVGQTVSDVERDLIIDTVQHCLGNRTHAANILGISIRTLRNKLKQYNQQGFSIPMPGEVESPVA